MKTVAADRGAMPSEVCSSVPRTDEHAPPLPANDRQVLGRWRLGLAATLLLAGVGGAGLAQDDMVRIDPAVRQGEPVPVVSAIPSSGWYQPSGPQRATPGQSPTGVAPIERTRAALEALSPASAIPAPSPGGQSAGAWVKPPVSIDPEAARQFGFPDTVPPPAMPTWFEPPRAVGVPVAPRPATPGQGNPGWPPTAIIGGQTGQQASIHPRSTRPQPALPGAPTAQPGADSTSSGNPTDLDRPASGDPDGASRQRTSANMAGQREARTPSSAAGGRSATSSPGGSELDGSGSQAQNPVAGDGAPRPSGDRRGDARSRPKTGSGSASNRGSGADGSAVRAGDGRLAGGGTGSDDSGRKTGSGPGSSSAIGRPDSGPSNRPTTGSGSAPEPAVSALPTAESGGRTIRRGGRSATGGSAAGSDAAQTAAQPGPGSTGSAGQTSSEAASGKKPRDVSNPSGGSGVPAASSAGSGKPDAKGEPGSESPGLNEGSGPADAPQTGSDRESGEGDAGSGSGAAPEDGSSSGSDDAEAGEGSATVAATASDADSGSEGGGEGEGGGGGDESETASGSGTGAAVLLAQNTKLAEQGKWDLVLRNLEQEPATNESAPLLVLKLQAQLNQKKPNWVQIKQTGEAISSVEPTNGWGPYGQAQYYINCPKPDPTKALALLDKARAAKVVPPGTGSAYWMLWLKRKWWLFLLLLGGAGAGAKAAIDKRRKAQLAGLEAAGAGDPTTTDGGTETVAPSDESGATVTSAVAGPEEELPVIAGAPTVSDGESSGGEETAGAG